VSIDVLMPALSPTMEEGTLAKWFIKAGDAVRSGDVIAEIETDKATMEVEAVDEGVVEAILVPEGAEGVKVNAPIARLTGAAATAALAAAPAPPPEAAPAVKPVQSSITLTPAAAATPALAAQAPAGPAKAASAGRVFASPLARRLASQAGVDLSGVKGSGPHGRIVQRDVERLKGEPAPAGAASVSAAAPAGVKSLEQMGIAPGSYDLVPMDGMLKTIARRMTDSFRDVPHFPLTIDLEIDRLLEARTRINAMLEKDGVKVSVNDIIIKAAANALKRVPAANASYTPEGFARHRHADVAFAVALDHGLITPIIRAAETKGLAQIATESKDLAERARTKKLKLEEFQGGTFTVSNLGMFGIKTFNSIISQPQGAIMSVGAGEKRPVVRGDALAIATVMSITLTCDHRVVDGAIGARFLATFRAMIEEPLAMLA
jgi:pyruvate dehydrogenase E2 component (dihydrolipoamide acetyltransferase)